MKSLPTFLAATLALCACSDRVTGPTEARALVAQRAADDAAIAGLTVMTRNMYVGTDVDRAITTPDPNQIPFVVGELWELLLANDYPSRAAAMAREIAEHRPHVVGLQEVSLFRSQTPADFQLNAQDVEIDFLATLLDELAALGMSYDVAAIVENTDVELPRLNADFSLTDVRLTDYDAILVRADVERSGPAAANYHATVPGPGGVAIKRGWTATDITMRGRTFRVVNTHLEPVETAGGVFQAQQANELVGLLTAETRPTILMGDLNTVPGGGATYGELAGAGFVDSWDLRRGRPEPGLTCCFSTDLSSDAIPLEKRVDHVLLRNFEELWPPSGPVPVQATIVGDEPSEKTTSGLWPSDHAGLVTKSALPTPSS